MWIPQKIFGFQKPIKTFFLRCHRNFQAIQSSPFLYIWFIFFTFAQTHTFQKFDYELFHEIGFLSHTLSCSNSFHFILWTKLNQKAWKALTKTKGAPLRLFTALHTFSTQNQFRYHYWFAVETRLQFKTFIYSESLTASNFKIAVAIPRSGSDSSLRYAACTHFPGNGTQLDDLHAWVRANYRCQWHKNVQNDFGISQHIVPMCHYTISDPFRELKFNESAPIVGGLTLEPVIKCKFTTKLNPADLYR